MVKWLFNCFARRHKFINNFHLFSMFAGSFSALSLKHLRFLFPPLIQMSSSSASAVCGMELQQRGIPVGV